MKVFYFSSLAATHQGGYTRSRTQEEIEKKGAEFVYVHLKDVGFEYDNGEIRMLINGEDVGYKESAFILRKLGDEYETFWLTFYTILKLARENDIPAFNGDTFSEFPHLEDKLFQQTYFASKGFPVIEKTQYFSTLKQFEKSEITFPLFAKPRTGSCGDGVVFFENLDQVQRYFFKNDISNHIFQRYVENKYDLRVVTSKDGVIGAMKRFRSSGLVNNFSAGGSVELFDLPEDLAKLCVEVCNSVKADHLGIDLIFDEVNKEYYLLEVNRFMAFEGFEKATDMNYAEKLIETILK